MTEASQTPRFSALLEKINAALPDASGHLGRKGHKDFSSLRDYLGKNHAQVFEWVTGRVLPNAEICLGMQEWLADISKKSNKRKVPATGQSK